jgi:hypothetical protein
MTALHDVSLDDITHAAKRIPPMPPDPAYAAHPSGSHRGVLESALHRAGYAVDSAISVPDRTPSDPHTAYLQSLQTTHRALATFVQPLAVTVIDKPFLIWEFPHPDGAFVDSTLQPLNSQALIKINEIVSHDNRQFVFHFLHENTPGQAQFVDVASALILNGRLFVQAAPGIFSGTRVDLFVRISLDIIRWSGWGAGLDQTHVQNPGYTGGLGLDLHAEGGHIFQGAGSASQDFTFAPTEVGFTGLGIPGGAVTMFRVILDLAHTFDDGGGDIQDNVTVDFADAGHFVACPSVVLIPRGV